MSGLTGRIVAVTGANSGLGKETAVCLAKEGIHVIMLCRDMGRAEAARADMVSRSGSAGIDIQRCDLSSFESVRDCSAQILGNYSHLDALVNNAGLIQSRRSETVDGHERQFQVNYLSPFLLTQLLLGMLNSSDGRIINVSSSAHYFGRINLEDLDGRKSYFGVGAYAQSKLANIMFTYELSRRNTGVAAVNCIDPGFVRTPVGSLDSSYISLIMGIITPLFDPADRSAKNIADLATSPLFEGVTGQYFLKSKLSGSSSSSHDQGVSSKLWDISSEMVSFYLH